MAYTNGNSQTRVGVRIVPQVNASTLWNSIYSVYNADSVGSSSLKTSLYAAYNGESNTNDSFGTNNGTAQGGLTYAAGKIGNAFNFNGTNAYVSLPNNSMNFTGDFSYSAWVYFRDIPSGERYIITATNGNGVDVNFGVGFGLISGQLALGVYSNTDLSAWKSDTTLIPSTWYHVTVTKKVSNAPKFYINGTLRTTTLLAGPNTLNPAYTSGAYPNSLATIGAYRFNNGSNTYGYCNANIDAVNTWSKELTQEEITDLYNSGNGAQYITDSFYKPTTNNALGTNNGTAQGGLTYGVGKVGTAFQFNGSNSVVELPTNSMNFTGDFSFSFFVNLATATGTQTVFGNAAYTGAQGDKGYAIRFINSKLNISLFNVSIIANVTSTTTVSANQWYHYVVVKVGQQIKIYCNSSLEITSTFSGSIAYRTPDTFPSIGALYKYALAHNSYDFLSNGSKVDAFNAWNRVLTQSEITELYNSGNGKQYPN